jgi:hypothetical protein
MRYAVFNDSDAASNVAVAAKAGYKVRLYGLVLHAASAVNVTIEDTDGTDLIGLCALVANGNLSLVLPTTGVPYTETADGKGIAILLGGAVQTGGCLVYEYVQIV